MWNFDVLFVWVWSRVVLLGSWSWKIRFSNYSWSSHLFFNLKFSIILSKVQSINSIPVGKQNSNLPIRACTLTKNNQSIYRLVYLCSHQITNFDTPCTSFALLFSLYHSRQQSSPTIGSLLRTNGQSQGPMMSAAPILFSTHRAFLRLWLRRAQGEIPHKFQSKRIRSLSPRRPQFHGSHFFF